MAEKELGHCRRAQELVKGEICLSGSGERPLKNVQCFRRSDHEVAQKTVAQMRKGDSIEKAYSTAELSMLILDYRDI